VTEPASKHFNGPVERRGNSLIVLVGEERFLALLQDYLDPAQSDEDIRQRAPKFMNSSGEFDAKKSRRALLQARARYDESKIVRYPFKPFDTRLAHLDTSIHPLFSRPSPELLSVRDIAGVGFFITRDHSRQGSRGPAFFLFLQSL
jgi:hypothetical protein